MGDCKIIKFRNKKVEIKERLKKQHIKNVAHFLIDSCEGDFAIVFKSKDLEHLFDGVEEKEFIVAMSDIEKRKVDHPNYFFTKFSDRQYFNLKD